MERDLTAVEVLGFAVQSEEEAAKFYGDLAKVVGNPLVRARFEELAREEVRHRGIIVALYGKLTGEAGAPPKVPGNPTLAEEATPRMVVEELEELLSLAIARERKARDFYRAAAKKASDETTRRTLEYLADIERGHELLLATELEAYRRDKNWYAEKPDIQLEGP